MPGRMTRSAPQSPFELPEVTAVVRATHLSGQNAEKAQKFTPVRGSSGESRMRSVGPFLFGPCQSRDAERLVLPNVLRQRQVRADVDRWPHLAPRRASHLGGGPPFRG